MYAYAASMQFKIQPEWVVAADKFNMRLGYGPGSLELANQLHLNFLEVSNDGLIPQYATISEDTHAGCYH